MSHRRDEEQFGGTLSPLHGAAPWSLSRQLHAAQLTRSSAQLGNGSPPLPEETAMPITTATMAVCATIFVSQPCAIHRFGQ